MSKDLLEKDIQFLKGVGPQKVEVLNRLGIYNVFTYFTYYVLI